MMIAPATMVTPVTMSAAKMSATAAPDKNSGDHCDANG